MSSPQFSTPITDAIIIAVSQLVDDAQSARRDPSHNDLAFQINRAGLAVADPTLKGQTVGKTKRLRAVLNWSLENDDEGGSKLIAGIISCVKGHGGFRASSPNYVGQHLIENLAASFSQEGFELSQEGELRPVILDSLAGLPLTDALRSYVRRAKRGATDAALVIGTGKDLLEAIAGHVLQEREGGYEPSWNFPMLLGRAFMALGMVTPAHPKQPGEPPSKEIERSMYLLACAVNKLRNKEGTGHGRPWLSSVGESDAKFAIEAMGIVGERMLRALTGS